MCLISQQAPSETGNEVWFLTLSDLLMLLLIFFVLLFGITLKQQDKSAIEPTAVKQILTPPVVQQQTAAGLSPSNMTAENATAILAADLQKIIDDRQGLTVKRHSQYVVLTFPEQIIFDSGQARIKDSVGPVLKQVAVFIQDHLNWTVEIQGHTDDIPISTRRYPSNWELSADRATQVARSLVEQGINPVRISAKGFGQYQPLCSNASAEGRLKNRRVELQFFFTPSS